MCGTAVGTPHGAAPGASLVVVDLGTADHPETLFVPPDVGHTVLDWLVDHADVRVVSLSWGTASDQYTEMARQLDEHVATHDTTVVVVAAGNAGRDGTGSVGSPATAKNVVAVGATYNVPTAFTTYETEPHVFVDEGGTYPYASSGPATVNPTTVAAFSGRGPTADGRRKPDVVAPGTPVVSARSGTPCGRMARHGTSMAAPLVAGLVARIQHAWPTASAALVKAALIAWTVPADGGVVDTVTRSDGYVDVDVRQLHASVHDQGFGVARLGSLDRTWTADRVPVPSSSHVVHWTATPQDDASAAIATLAGGTVVVAWTDPPAAVNARRALVHDVDVDVVVTFADGRTVRYGGGGEDGRPDRRNNVERVGPLPTGAVQWDVRVRGITLHTATQTVAVVVVVDDDDHPWTVTHHATAVPEPCTASAPCVVRDGLVVTGSGRTRCDDDDAVCDVTACDDDYYFDGTTCRVLACATAMPCPVAHGTGRTCGHDECVVVRCHAGYVLGGSGTCTCTHGGCADDDHHHHRYHRDVLRPSWSALVGLAVVVAVLASVTCPAWHVHHRRHTEPTPVTASYRPPRLVPAAAPVTAPTATLDVPSWHVPRAPVWTRHARRFPRLKRR